MNNINNRIEFDELKKPRYMMATAANHRYGILSSKEPSLCFVYGETEDCFVGCWIFLHTNCSDVLFPKKSTRALTSAEEIANMHIESEDKGLRLREKYFKRTTVR